MSDLDVFQSGKVSHMNWHKMAVIPDHILLSLLLKLTVHLWCLYCYDLKPPYSEEDIVNINKYLIEQRKQKREKSLGLGIDTGETCLVTFICFVHSIQLHGAIAHRIQNMSKFV